MSKINKKEFNPEHKIVRSVFEGSPNLFTAADLNRQFEALKFQCDTIEDAIGFSADHVDFDMNLTKGTLTLSNFDYFNLKVKGCKLTPSGNKLTINLNPSIPKAYLYIVAEKKLVKYEDDPEHNIAGVTCADGKTLPAANQIVYTNEEFVLTHSHPWNVPNFVGLVCEIRLTPDGLEKIDNFNSPDIAWPLSIRVDELWYEVKRLLKPRNISGNIVNGRDSSIMGSYTMYIVGNEYRVVTGDLSANAPSIFSGDDDLKFDLPSQIKPLFGFNRVKVDIITNYNTNDGEFSLGNNLAANVDLPNGNLYAYGKNIISLKTVKYLRFQFSFMGYEE